MIIAIDGPSGAGKSTLAKRLARELGYTYLDTGAMYRALALKVLRHGIDLDDDARLSSLIEQTVIELSDRGAGIEVWLDGENVAGAIRTPEISQMASRVSALKKVRARMLELQRAMGTRGAIVAEGRDIGTVVFPEAEVKVFLDASLHERARRRFEELKAGGGAVAFEQTLREMAERDRRDSERDIAPLCQAADAVRIDSSISNADEVGAMVLQLVRSKSKEN